MNSSSLLALNIPKTRPTVPGDAGATNDVTRGRKGVEHGYSPL